MAKKEQKVLTIKLWKVELTIQNMSQKVALLIAGAVLILAICIGYSFLRGWSSINATIEEEITEAEGEIIHKIEDEEFTLEQRTPPGVPVTVIKDGERVEIRKGESND